MSATAQLYDCEFATNAGYFNTMDGRCYGDIVSDGRTVQLPRKQNAHFGLRTDRTLEVGYLDNVFGADRVNASSRKAPFWQLITGAVWLVRNGTNYVSESVQLEDASIQETGTMATFASILSARTALGHDRSGTIVVAQWTGRSYQSGYGHA